MTKKTRTVTKKCWAAIAPKGMYYGLRAVEFGYSRDAARFNICENNGREWSDLKSKGWTIRRVTVSWEEEI